MRSFLAILIFLLVLGQAHAGYYSVSYSSPGNEIAIVGPLGTHWSRSYSLTPYGYGGAATGDEPPPSFFIGGPGSVDCTGTITATFTWVNPPGDTEPPPHSVIVEHFCNAGWDGDSGSANNALGDPEISKVSMGAQAEIISNPGTSFYVQRSPQAHGLLNNPPITLVPQAYAGLYYTAVATPVRLVIDGALRDANWDYSCMVGHKLHATLDLGGYTPDNLTWAWPMPSGYFHHVEWGSRLNNSSFGRQLYDSREIKDHTLAQMSDDHFDWVYEEDASGQAMGSVDILYEGSSIGRVQGKAQLEAFKPYIYYGRNMLTSQWNGLNPGAFAGANSSQTPWWATTTVFGSAYFEGREGEPPRFNSYGHGAWAFVQTLASNVYWTTTSSANGSDIFADFRLDNTYPYWKKLVPSSPPDAPSSCPMSLWTSADSVGVPPLGGTTGWAADSPEIGIDNLLSYHDERNFRMMQVYYPMSLFNGVEQIGVYEVAWEVVSNGSRSAGPPLPLWNSSNTGGSTSLNPSSLATCNRHLQWTGFVLNTGASTSSLPGSSGVPGEP